MTGKKSTESLPAGSSYFNNARYSSQNQEKLRTLRNQKASVYQGVDSSQFRTQYRVQDPTDAATMTNATHYRSQNLALNMQGVYDDEDGITIGRNVMIMHDKSLDSVSGETYSINDSRANSPAPAINSNARLGQALRNPNTVGQYKRQRTTAQKNSSSVQMLRPLHTKRTSRHDAHNLQPALVSANDYSSNINDSSRKLQQPRLLVREEQPRSQEVLELNVQN